MAFLSQKIGARQFLKITGHVQPPKQRITVIERNNVDGVSLQRQGVKGERATLTTLVDMQTIQDAYNEIDRYLALIGANGQEYIKDGFTSLLQDYRIMVVNVATTQLKAAIVVNGLNVADGASGFMLEARWSVIPVSNP